MILYSIIRFCERYIYIYIFVVTIFAPVGCIRFGLPIFSVQENFACKIASPINLH